MYNIFGLRAVLNGPNFSSKLKKSATKSLKLNLFILKDVTWASKLSTLARVSGHQRHVPARAKSVQYNINIRVQS